MKPGFSDVHDDRCIFSDLHAGDCKWGDYPLKHPDSTHTGDPEPRCGECGEPRVKELPGATWWHDIQQDHQFVRATAHPKAGHPMTDSTHTAAPAVTGEACGHEFPVIPGQHSTDAICKKCGSSRREARKVEREAAPASETGAQGATTCPECINLMPRYEGIGWADLVHMHHGAVEADDELEARAERLEAASEGLAASYAGMCYLVMNYSSEQSQLHQALIQFGEHKTPCRLRHGPSFYRDADCVCGLAAALEPKGDGA